MSQPTLSVASGKIEQELGVTVFARGSGEVSITPVGARIVEQAQRVLTQVQGLREIADQGQDPLQGRLRLGVIYTIAPYLLPALVRLLHQRAPQMPLMLQENYTHRLCELLQQDDIDAAIMALPLEEAGLVIQPLYDEDFVVAVPCDHPWARRWAVRSAGGESTPAAQRRSSKGQNATTPGRMARRKPHDPWAACGSILGRPSTTNGSAKSAPQAR